MPKINGRNKNKILAIVAVLIIVVSSVAIYSFISNNRSVVKELGPGLELSIKPSQVQILNNNTVQLINASVQLYMNNPPSVTQGVEAFTNTTPLFNGVVNSTGNISVNISASFLSLAENWTLYFMETNNTGASTSLTMQISYLYKNGSYYYVYFNTVIIPIDPAFFISPVGSFQKVTTIEGYHHLYNLSIKSHPPLNSLKGYRVQYIHQMGIAGGSGHYMWVLKKQHTFSSYPIPLAWANNSILQNNTEEIDLSVTLISTNQASLIYPGQVTYQNGTYSWSILNGSSYNYNWVIGAVAYGALPVKEGAPTGVMLYVMGSTTIDVYQLYVNTAGGWQPTNNIQSITEIASINPVNSDKFESQMGYMNLTRGSTWSLMEPENLVKYLFTSGSIKTAYYNMTNGETTQWDTRLFGLGFSTIAVIAAGTGWYPESGWTNLESDVVAITGMPSSIYVFVTGMLPFMGDIHVQQVIQGTPNSLELKVITINTPLSIINSRNLTNTTGEYNITVYDISAISQ